MSFDDDELREEIGIEFASLSPTPQEAIEDRARYLFNGCEYLTERPNLVGSAVAAARMALKRAGVVAARSRRVTRARRAKTKLVQLERCSENGCPFFAMPGYRWCFRHVRSRVPFELLELAKKFKSRRAA